MRQEKIIEFPIIEDKNIHLVIKDIFRLEGRLFEDIVKTKNNKELFENFIKSKLNEIFIDLEFNNEYAICYSDQFILDLQIFKHKLLPKDFVWPRLLYSKGLSDIFQRANHITQNNTLPRQSESDMAKQFLYWWDMNRHYYDAHFSIEKHTMPRFVFYGTKFDVADFYMLAREIILTFNFLNKYIGDMNFNTQLINEKFEAVNLFGYFIQQSDAPEKLRQDIANFIRAFAQKPKI